MEERRNKMFVDFIPEKLNGCVLTVQSHVVHGYVGNKASCTVLQILGFEVRNINSVQFSNHTGYRCCKGTKMTAEQLNEIFEGLQKNDLLKDITHIQTGYIGSKEFLFSMLDIIKEMKKVNPNIIYLCDPVIGDVVLRNGVLKKEIYVPKELVNIYRNEIVKVADIITPNQMEAEIITGIEIKNEKDVLRSIDYIHNLGICVVVITSCELEEEGILALYGSRRLERREIEEQGEEEDGENAKRKVEIVRIEFARKKGYFSGVGDAIASLILAWTHTQKDDFVGGIEKAFNTVQCMVENTKSGEELNVIRCRKIIEKPNVLYHAKKVK